MPRMERKPKTTKSEHWLRCAVEQHAEALNSRVRNAFGFSANEEIEWLSPIREDGYAEYRDQAFLDRLGVGETLVPLKSFWPKGGPQWDGLAKTNSNKYILVEAKAYASEARTKCQAEDVLSLEKISASLEEAKRFFGVGKDGRWKEPYYQYANRLAHLYFMRHLNKLDTFLVFLNFANAPDVSNPCNHDQWKKENASIEKTLGLVQQTPPEGVATIIWSVPDMLQRGGSVLIEHCIDLSNGTGPSQ